MHGHSLRCRRVRWMPVVFVAACAAAPARPVAPPELPADRERDYAIWLGGARVGTAHETERWSPTGVTLQRTEAMRFLRGNVPIAIATVIEITADRALAPSRVTWTEHAQTTRHAEARRDATGWTIIDDAGQLDALHLPAAAIPAELAPLIVRRDGRFAGPVFLPARGFVAGDGRIEPVAPHRLIAQLTVNAGAAPTAPAASGTAPASARAVAEATIDLGDDAMPVRVVDGEGVIATRITAAEAAIAFAPVDVIAATSIPLTGSPSPGRRRIVLEGDLVLPAVPGQASRVTPEGIELVLSPRLVGALPPGPPSADRIHEIIALVADVRRRIAPDLAAAPTSVRTASGATAGDCTTFALAYAALAGDRAIPTRIVTGFRIDGERLVRHRWAISWTGGAWIAVDVAFGSVPAGGDLVALAVHAADDIGLLAGEALLLRVRAARR
jgi:hypothetical protein